MLAYRRSLGCDARHTGSVSHSPNRRRLPRAKAPDAASVAGAFDRGNGRADPIGLTREVHYHSWLAKEPARGLG